MGGNWPPSRFWQYWALAGMVVLTAAFWWAVEGYAVFEARRHGQIVDGLLRFTLLILTPALVLAWFAAARLRRRVGEAGYWQLLGLLAMTWAGSVLAPRISLSLLGRALLSESMCEYVYV